MQHNISHNTSAAFHPQPECFICGRHESKSIKLRIIRRWKTIGRAVSLIIDTVCSTCDDKYKLVSSKPTPKNENV